MGVFIHRYISAAILTTVFLMIAKLSPIADSFRFTPPV
jgi:hypothetical protein